jgi:4-amino-4-deoxy-L-arabinose transferase-like glycosyltransferase
MPPIAPRIYRLMWLFAIAVRLALTATTYGTNDAIFTTTWVELVNRVGIAHAYAMTPMLNHPPLSLAYMKLVDAIGSVFGIAFTDVLRTAQILADVVSAFALYRIGRADGPHRASALASFVLLSPAAAFLSAFHCNTDPTMTALIILAAALAIVPLRDTRLHGILVGLTLGLAAGIKILPFVLAPIFLLYLPREQRVRFIVAFGVVTALIFVPSIAIGGPVVIRHIFGYAGNLPYEWGVPGVAFAISRNVPSLHDEGAAAMKLYTTYGRYIVYAGMIAALAFLALRRHTSRTALPHALAIMLMTILALAPGWGVQYVAWIIPLLPFALPWTSAVLMNAALSLYLFITYTVWNGGWPWWFADIARRSPYRWISAVAGYATWLCLCAALIAAIRGYRAAHRAQTAG